MKKRYSAFVSSVYTSLLDEREQVIQCLLNQQWIPICMEYFTLSAADNFSALQDLIDDSDIVVLLLGREYGSVDESDGKSWTEKEFDYAVEQKKPICALVCPEYGELEAKDPATLTEAEKKQIAFAKKAGFARRYREDRELVSYLTQFISAEDNGTLVGWSRNRGNERMQAAWREANRVFDLGGKWYHIHLSEEDASYIRVGDLLIGQTFDMENYRDLSFKGSNYSAVQYDPKEDRLLENRMQYTSWTGNNYQIEEDGEILGLFHARRHFSGKFKEETVGRGEHRGIHDFALDLCDRTATTEFIGGTFHDEAPSPKHGLIYLFRTEAARLAFLKENFPFLLEQISK